MEDGWWAAVTWCPTWNDSKKLENFGPKAGPPSKIIRLGQSKVNIYFLISLIVVSTVLSLQRQAQMKPYE